MAAMSLTMLVFTSLLALHASMQVFSTRPCKGLDGLFC